MSAAGMFITTHAARAWMGDATNLLAQATFKAALLTSGWTPNMATQSVWGDISASEVANGNGYTTGGNTMTGVSYTQTGGVAKFTGTIPGWTAAGAGLTHRYVAIYAVGTFNGHINPLVGYFICDSAPADIVTAPGNVFQVNTPANGFFTLTQE